MEFHNIARTKEGHAAQAGVDKWILIQENTFRNWVNEQLRPGGLEVTNLKSDFYDGVKLCLLIQALQGKRIRVIKNPRNHHQQLANVAEALQAIANDNIKLVNIEKWTLFRIERDIFHPIFTNPAQFVYYHEITVEVEDKQDRTKHTRVIAICL